MRALEIEKYNLITITGATASGKTAIAANLALKINGEIISADSRQVYKNMDIGTGKDIHDYTIDGVNVPYHLINIVEAGTKYNVYEYKKDFSIVYNNIISRNKTPILCGGTGLYIEAVLKNYNMIYVPTNDKLRTSLKDKTIDELENILTSYKPLHNKSDLDTRKRAIRAIEIEDFYKKNYVSYIKDFDINPIIIGIYFEREERRKRITERLIYRLENGLIEEVENLIQLGISNEDIEYYGLEYKFVSWYLSGKINYDELFTQLNSAIHQFSKRQMTWFRKMERNGTKIKWIDGILPMNKKIETILIAIASKSDI